MIAPATTAPSLPWTETQDGLILRIRATPRASRNMIKGLLTLPDGVVLTIAITAPPAEGAANTAIVQTLAKTLRIPKSAVHIVSGDTARIKRVEVRGDKAALIESLSQFVG